LWPSSGPALPGYAAQDMAGFHRMVFLGRDLKYHLVPTPPHHGQGHLPPDQFDQSPIQADIEYWQGGDIHSFSGQPVPGPHHPHSEEFLNLPSFSLKPLPLVLSLHALGKSPSSAFLQARFRYCKAAVRFPRGLLFSS